MRRIGGVLELGESIVERACALFWQAQSAALLQGRSIEAMAAASVYATCRCNGLPRTPSDVAAPARVEAERVRHCYAILNRELDLPTVPPSPAVYVPRFASELGLSDGTRHYGTQLAERAHDRGLSNGKNPAGVAAGALYLAARERAESVTQAALADVASVSTVTVRNRWEELQEAIEDGPLG